MNVRKTLKQPLTRRSTATTHSVTDTHFSLIIDAFKNNADVAPTRMFGSDGLKISGKVFAMMVKDDLVVKLPKARVEALVTAKLGGYFDPGHGRLMKEWVAIKPAASAEWLKLAKEALQFVTTGL